MQIFDATYYFCPFSLIYKPLLYMICNCISTGNVISDGRLVQDTEGVQNVHFGITKKGKIFIG